MSGQRRDQRVRLIGNAVSVLNTSTVRPPPKTTEPFYSSPEWRQLLEQLIRQRGRRCQECGARGCRVYGDHVRELKDGGERLDPNNVLLRCASCHGRKTAAERARRLATPATHRWGMGSSIKSP